jgi:ATP-binding cassette subfamily F protein 3
VIGKNGRGKTTLLKLMAGVLSPLAGEISCPLAVSQGYFEQANVSCLGQANSVVEEIAGGLPDSDPRKARMISAAMLFEGDSALKRISILSGGEKSRVILGKIIATPSNLLLLDEPTNHLDMESSDALLAAVDNFEGAVIMVTHNETFLQALAERLIVFEDEGIRVYEGGYQRFLEKVGWKEEGTVRPGELSGDSSKEKIGKKELRRLRSEILAERSRKLRPLEERIAEVEKRIEANEAELERLNQALAEASAAQQGSRVVELSRAMHSLKKEVDDLFAELSSLNEKLEDQKAEFEKKLSEVGAEE